MPKVTTKKQSEGGGLDKLAQLRKRARAKFIGLPKVYALIDVAKEEQDKDFLAGVEKDWVKSYSLTLSCANVIVQNGVELTSKYCNQRWCNVCNRIRTAKLINKYGNALGLESDLYFVTLSKKNVKPIALKSEISNLLKVSKNIQETARKRGTPIVGIRKLECTYNATRKDYHPHLHFLIRGKVAANYFRDEWIKRNESKSDKRAQDVRKATEGSIHELFKYASKEVVKVNGKKGIDVEALHEIHKALNGYRVFQTIGGFAGIDQEDQEDQEALKVEAQKFEDLTPNKAVYEWNVYDWYNTETGEALTGYVPKRTDVKLSNSIIYKNEKVYELSG